VKGSNTEGYNLLNGEGADLFGTSVALSGDGNTLAVGAPGEDSALTGVRAGIVSEATSGNGASNSGAVYVFARTGTTWLQQAYVKASNTGEGDNFGNSVALSGDGNMLAVGAPFEDGTRPASAAPRTSRPPMPARRTSTPAAAAPGRSRSM